MLQDYKKLLNFELVFFYIYIIKFVMTFVNLCDILFNKITIIINL